MTQEEIVNEFVVPEKLIKFVLEDCCDLKLHDEYEWFHPTVTISKKDMSRIIITIDANFDMEKIYYLHDLLKIGFNIDIYSLIIGDIQLYGSGKVTDIDNPQFLEKIDKLQILQWAQNMDIPKLPKSLQKIRQYDLYNWAEIKTTRFDGMPDMPLRDVHQYILDKITKGEIRV